MREHVHHCLTSILVVYLQTVLPFSVTEQLRVFNILLEGLVICDIQIFHDVQRRNIDWFNVKLPVKIVQDFNYIPYDTRAYQINIFKSRAATNCKFVILISAHSLEIGRVYLGEKLDKWIDTAASYHLFNPEDYWLTVGNNETVMTIVTMKSNVESHGRVYFWSGKYFKISLLFILRENQVQFCTSFREELNRNILTVIQNQKHPCDAGSVGNLRSRSVFDISQYFAILSPPWCYARGFNTDKSYLKFDIYGQKDKNPFDARIYNPQLQNILGIIFNIANETLLLKSSCFGYEALLCDESSGWTDFDVLTVTTQNLGFELISCYRNEFMTFEFYVTPFKSGLWATLLISLLIIIVITSTYAYFIDLINTSLLIWLFVLATIFEETGHLTRKVEGHSFFRLILGSWCLMSVILTNCYNGVMISHLNAPLDASRPTLFDYLLCERMPTTDAFKMSKRIDFYYDRIKNNIPLTGRGEKLPKYGYDRIAWYMFALAQSLQHQKGTSHNGPESKPARELQNPFTLNKCFHLLSHPKGYVSGYPSIPEFLEYLFFYVQAIPDNILFVPIANKDMQMLNLFDPRNTHHSMDFKYSGKNQTFVQLRNNVESELLESGRSVYISKSDIIEAELNFLTKHYPKKRFYKGKEIFQKDDYFWNMKKVGESKVPKYFKAVAESGIYGRLGLEEIHQKYLGRKPVKREKSGGDVTLDGAFLTMFIICGGTVALASFAFVVEVRLIILRWTFNAFKFVSRKIINLF
ncbi:hypothetical protein Fcan01_23189 [Folsomia candida]|uniref:Uncharacterized protein n=1 Tax=Folsomia candida TaxID=158441 RepID=A0A226DAA4_FOLCA|nr:hypothetical protein Fcan01_23189 [Folsomia candida]